MQTDHRYLNNKNTTDHKESLYVGNRFPQKTLKKSHKSLPFTIKTSLGQKQTLLIL